MVTQLQICVIDSLMNKEINLEFGVDYLFGDLFPNPRLIAGVKAVFAPMTTRYLCFGHGGATAAASTASKMPWAICIGTSNTWDASNQGRVLNVVKMTTSHQATSKLVSDEEERSRFSRWPEAVALTDVFEFPDAPHVLDDLHMTTHPLLQAYDKISALTVARMPIIAALGGHRIRLADLPPLSPEITLGKIIPRADSS